MLDEQKKTTAPNPSVGADEGQSLNKNTNIIPDCYGENNGLDAELQAYFREQQQRNDPAYLPTVTLNELMEQVYQGRGSIVENLLYTGAYLLAGAPKIGKSFLVAQLAYHVSVGRPIWGYRVKQGAVLYLALEDDMRRLQQRMSRMFDVDGTDNLYFATQSKQIGQGLEEQLNKFLREHRNTKLVIVDTLQKVREVSGDAYSYAKDYEIISKLKQIADLSRVCVLIVHHTRKQPAGDSFEMISGTTGLLGCADGAFLMQKEQRTAATATADAVGRDRPERRLYLRRGQERLLWTLERVENELWRRPPDPLLERVAGLVQQQEGVWEGSATQLCRLLGIDLLPNALARQLNVKAGELASEHQVQYTSKRTSTGSKIFLKKQSE